MTPDPFGTAGLRAATLQAWASSPTRLREDAASEADLVRGGYRDRVLTELAQNAADAATRAGVPGVLRVDLADGALRVANTGAPLDVAGVQALAALRASGKTSGVGRFGVGFTAVLAVTDEPRVLSRTGSVAFSRSRTRAELEVDGPGVEGLGVEGDVPVLRLAWPVDEAPVPGADTEVVLPLRAGVDGAALLAACAAEATELLLELDGLVVVEVGGRRRERTHRPRGPGIDELVVGGRTWWRSSAGRSRWLVELVDGDVRPCGPDVLRAPTRTDEELSLPALLVADVALAPDRRRVLPDADVSGLASGYVELVRALEPGARTRLVPRPGFPRGALDEELRAQVLAALSEHPWLPAAGGGADVDPRSAVVLDADSPALVRALDGVVPGLLVAELSAGVHAAALAALGVPRLGPAGVADAVAGLAREPSWWHALYSALEPLLGVHDRPELAALAVPLADGRTVLGPHTCVLLDGVDVLAPAPASASFAQPGRASASSVQREPAPAPAPWARLPGLRVVHTDAAHPLLVRLGATACGPAELLAHPAVQQAVAELDPDDAPAAAAVAAAVLALVAVAAPRPGEHAWLGGLLLPDTTGELRAADELLLPGAPLGGLLVADAPLGTLDPAVAQEHGPAVLRAVGVGWGFTVLHDEQPVGPDHDLDDEQQWWDDLGQHRATLTAVRDLELVAPTAWRGALALLHAEPDTLAALRVPDGHTAWWLRRHARLDGVPLAGWRAADDPSRTGLLDVVPVAVDRALLAGDHLDAALARLLLQRLADPTRTPSPAVVAGTHAALAAAVQQGTLAVEELDAPADVRAADGGVVAADDALVLDHAWLAQVHPAGALVLGALGPAPAAPADVLADLLEVALASEETGPVTVGGRDTAVRTVWGERPEVVLACAQLDRPVPDGSLALHERLVVVVDGREHAVAWWVEPDGTVHAAPDGLLPALLHALGAAPTPS